MIGNNTGMYMLKVEAPGYVEDTTADGSVRHNIEGTLYLMPEGTVISLGQTEPNYKTRATSP